jgi:hypothetical protein
MDLASSGRAALSAPSELAGPLPRPVRLNLNGDARYLFMLVLLFFVGGCIVLGWTAFDDVQQFQRRAVLRTDGREVIGEITGFSHTHNGPTKVKYRFPVYGVTYTGSAAEPDTWGSDPSLSKSDRILVRFLPSNPAINHPDAWEWTVFVGAVPTVFVIFFWVMGGFALVMLLRDRKLAREGKAASAIVTSCTRSDKLFRIEYEFRTEEGASMRGKSDRLEAQEAGAQIWILYLPKRPSRNQTYPLPLFDAAG